MLELHGVQAGYGSIQALRDVSLHVAEGEIVTLIGANGAGKSTTLMTICGLLTAQAGEIRFAASPCGGCSPTKWSVWGSSRFPKGAASSRR